MHISIYLLGSLSLYLYLSTHTSNWDFSTWEEALSLLSLTFSIFPLVGKLFYHNHLSQLKIWRVFETWEEHLVVIRMAWRRVHGHQRRIKSLWIIYRSMGIEIGGRYRRMLVCGHVLLFKCSNPTWFWTCNKILIWEWDEILQPIRSFSWHNSRQTHRVGAFFWNLCRQCFYPLQVVWRPVNLYNFFPWDLVVQFFFFKLT